MLLALACGTGEAARPFVTDDARVVDPGGWQVEAFLKRQRAYSEHELWVLPAHNPGESFLGGRVELTLGGNRVDSAQNGDSRGLVVQAKTLLKPLERNGAGYAFTLGMQRTSPAGTAGATANPYLNGIASFSFSDDAVVVHLNGGARRDQAAGMTRGTWGAGAELEFSERFIGIAELYGERGEKPTRHGGLRFWAVPGKVQVDSTLGWQRSAPDRRFHTIGVRVLW